MGGKHPVRELGATYGVDNKTLASSARLDFGSKRVLKLKHSHPSNAASLEASTPGWGLTYDLKSKEVVLEHKRNINMGNLSIKQRVPHKQLYLVPSPEIKMAFKPAFFLKSKLRSETTLSYDYQRGVGKISQLVASKSRYTATIQADSVTKGNGASVELTTRINSRHLTSVSLDLSKSRGPVISAAGTLFSGVHATKAKVNYKVRSKVATLDLTPPSYNKLRTTLTCAVKTDKLTARPSLSLGATLDL